jgi:hypothetical protein
MGVTPHVTWVDHRDTVRGVGAFTTTELWG